MIKRHFARPRFERVIRRDPGDPTQKFPSVTAMHIPTCKQLQQWRAYLALIRLEKGDHASPRAHRPKPASVYVLDLKLAHYGSRIVERPWDAQDRVHTQPRTTKDIIGRGCWTQLFRSIRDRPRVTHSSPPYLIQHWPWGTWGQLSAVLNRRFTHLEDRDDLTFKSRSPAITMRLEESGSYVVYLGQICGCSRELNSGATRFGR